MYGHTPMFSLTMGVTGILFLLAEFPFSQGAKLVISGLGGEYIPRVKGGRHFEGCFIQVGWGLVTHLRLTEGHICLSTSFLIPYGGN